MARVVVAHGGLYDLTASDPEQTFLAELSGKFKFVADDATEVPGVGDWVVIDQHGGGEGNTEAIIHAVVPRATVLQRINVGPRSYTQLIAANVDRALLVQSLDNNFNVRRLERMAAATVAGGIPPAVVLTKPDLVSDARVERNVAKAKDVLPQAPVVVCSPKQGDNMDAVATLLASGETGCLIGSSGVGKSSLVNALAGEHRMDIGEVRTTDRRGRHTTTRRQLLRLPNGAMLIDTPGMRTFAQLADEQEVEDTFEDVQALAELCQYRNCGHSKEQGCAVTAAVASGALGQDRLDGFLNLQSEAAAQRRANWGQNNESRRARQARSERAGTGQRKRQRKK